MFIIIISYFIKCDFSIEKIKKCWYLLPLMPLCDVKVFIFLLLTDNSTTCGCFIKVSVKYPVSLMSWLIYSVSQNNGVAKVTVHVSFWVYLHLKESRYLDNGLMSTHVFVSIMLYANSKFLILFTVYLF